MHSDAIAVPGSSALIEPATWRDLNELRRIEKICFPKDSWPIFDLVGVLTFPSVVRLKAVIDDHMVGFVAGDVRKSKKLAWIATICVLPPFRGQGIGGALLDACEERLNVPHVRLSVRTTNMEAIQLYLNRGYQKVGLWRNYYGDGEDALVMEKELKL